MEDSMKETMAALISLLVVRIRDIADLLSLNILTVLNFKVIICSSGLWQSQFMPVALLHSSKCQTLGNKVYGHLTEAWMMNWLNDWVLLNDENQLKELQLEVVLELKGCWSEFSLKKMKTELEIDLWHIPNVTGSPRLMLIALREHGEAEGQNQVRSLWYLLCNTDIRFPVWGFPSWESHLLIPWGVVRLVSSRNTSEKKNKRKIIVL